MHQPFDPAAYGPVFAELLAGDRCRALGPGQPDRGARDALAGFNSQQAFGGQSIAEEDMARLCESGLWLLYDYLDESHTISQGVHNTSGSYWHAIMHRREPDESNSKYWFRRVGDHPVYVPLALAARESAERIGISDASAYLTSGSGWDPFAFVDLCSAARRGHAPVEPLCREIQQRECELLWDYCYRQAVGQ
ncbi:MAG: hypothetical protein WDZ59_16880 [Pirellulales bacterium]